jgi:tRNA A-37 threonylcarbamoyl transferase component Bud32
MSANREDALTEVRGAMLPLERDPPAGPDPTEDLAEEITSELGSGSRLARAVAVAVPAPAADAGAPEAAKDPNVLRERYVLETQLGAGGTAVVYRAVDLRRDASALDGRHVAIKVLRPELRDRPEAVARLQREFRQSRTAAHAGVVRMHDLDCDGGRWFIVMELLTGETLGPALRRAAPAGLPADDAIRIACAAGEALAHAHAAGVVHGDVLRDNIFLTAAGDLRLLDFGVAPDVAAPASGERIAAAATRAYASPEVLAGSTPEPRDDVFSLACVAYEALAGARPYGSRAAGGAEPRPVEPLRPASLEPARWEALAGALSMERASRPDMQAFVRALRGLPEPAALPDAPAVRPEPAAAPVAWKAAEAPPAHPTAVLPAVAARPLEWRGRIPLLAAVAALLALVLGILIGRLREGPPPLATARIEAPLPAQIPETAAPAAAVVHAPAPAPDPAATGAGDAQATPTGPPGLVFFDAPRMVVSRHAVVAAIPMRHLSRVRRPVTLHWQIVEGSARAGRDFDGPSSGTETLVEGNSFRILYVPILLDPRADRDRSFTVEMTDVSAGTELGPTSRVEVTILGGA